MRSTPLKPQLPLNHRPQCHVGITLVERAVVHQKTLVLACRPPIPCGRILPGGRKDGAPVEEMPTHSHMLHQPDVPVVSHPNVPEKTHRTLPTHKGDECSKYPPAEVFVDRHGHARICSSWPEWHLKMYVCIVRNSWLNGNSVAGRSLVCRYTTEFSSRLGTFGAKSTDIELSSR